VETSAPVRLPDEVVVHHVGGKTLGNMRLRTSEKKLKPPGWSVLIGGLPEDAAKAMLVAFPDPILHSQIHQKAKIVASAAVGEIRGVGFDVVSDPTLRFPNHGRLVHSGGADAFTNEALEKLACVFREVTL